MYVCMYVDLVCANLISRQQSLPSWRSIFHGTKCSANNLEQQICTAVSAYSLQSSRAEAYANLLMICSCRIFRALYTYFIACKYV